MFISLPGSTWDLDNNFKKIPSMCFNSSIQRNQAKGRLLSCFLAKHQAINHLQVQDRAVCNVFMAVTHRQMRSEETDWGQPDGTETPQHGQPAPAWKQQQLTSGRGLMLTHLLVVDLKHLENCVLLPAFHGGYHSPELHYLNSSATAGGETRTKGSERASRAPGQR